MSTWTPKVCKIMAFMAVIMGFRAIILHTFGVQVGFIGSRFFDMGCGVSGLGCRVWVFMVWGFGPQDVSLLRPNAMP